MTVQDSIEHKLKEAFQPQKLEITNESHLHSGHASSPNTGHSHFRITIVSDQFEGKSRIDRHRMVNEILASELAQDIHALAIQALSPGEAG